MTAPEQPDPGHEQEQQQDQGEALETELVSPPADDPKQATAKAQVKKMRVLLDGRIRVFPVAKAERLIRLGHARKS